MKKQHKVIKVNDDIHFLSDEKPKEGDWCIKSYIMPGTEELCKYSNGLGNTAKKIVATTNEELIKDGVPEIPLDFIKLYAERGGIDEVILEYDEWYGNTLTPNKDMVYTLKVNPDNTVVWSLVEKEDKSELYNLRVILSNIETDPALAITQLIQFIKHYEQKEKMYSKEEVEPIITEMRDQLVLCTLLDKSGQCSELVEKVDKWMEENL